MKGLEGLLFDMFVLLLHSQDSMDGQFQDQAGVTAPDLLVMRRMTNNRSPLLIGADAVCFSTQGVESFLQLGLTDASALSDNVYQDRDPHGS